VDSRAGDDVEKAGGSADGEGDRGEFERRNFARRCGHQRENRPKRDCAEADQRGSGLILAHGGRCYQADAIRQNVGGNTLGAAASTPPRNVSHPSS